MTDQAIPFARTTPTTRRIGPAVARGTSRAIHAVVLLIGGVGMLIMAIAVLLDGASRWLDQRA